MGPTSLPRAEEAAGQERNCSNEGPGEPGEEGQEEERPGFLRSKVGFKGQIQEETQEPQHDKILKITYPRKCKQKHQQTARQQCRQAGAAFCTTLNTWGLFHLKI